MGHGAWITLVEGKGALCLSCADLDPLLFLPAGREQVIAEQACQKYSGRVGRSASAKGLDERAILLAVIAHIRHAETNYDELLSRGLERWEARDEVDEKIDGVLARWKGI